MHFKLIWFAVFPLEWEAGRGGQKWWGNTGGRVVQVYLSPQKRRVVLQRGGYREIIFNSPLLWGFARAWAVVDVSMCALGDSAEPWPSARQHCLNEDEGCPWAFKILWRRPARLILWGARRGFRHKLCPARWAVSSKHFLLNKSLSLCFPLSAPGQCSMRKAVLGGQMCWSCNPLPGCDSCMFFWLCHAETLPFLWRNYTTIKLGGTVAFQDSVSSPLFPCLTLPLRNLTFWLWILTRKWIWWLHS